MPSSDDQRVPTPDFTTKDETLTQPPTALDPFRWQHLAVFRESYLCLRVSEDVAESLRVIGRHIYPGSVFSLPKLEGSDPLQVALMAIARDLRHDQGLLNILGSQDIVRTKGQQRAQIARHVADSLSRQAISLEAASR